MRESELSGIASDPRPYDELQRSYHSNNNVSHDHCSLSVVVDDVSN